MADEADEDRKEGMRDFQRHQKNHPRTRTPLFRFCSARKARTRLPWSPPHLDPLPHSLARLIVADDARNVWFSLCYPASFPIEANVKTPIARAF
jgi:hypothetical protein